MPAKAQTFVHLLMAFLLAVSFMQPLAPRAFADDAAASGTAESAAPTDEAATTLPDGDFDDGGILPVRSSSHTDNVRSRQNIAQSLWYTKLIDLSGYAGKDVEGTLNFELVPDDTASGRYDTHDSDGTVLESLEVKPGVATFSYQVPFSSNDFVDPEFNRLAEGSANNNGDSVALFNYALLHEWGRMYSSDHIQTVRVGPLSRCQYASDEEYENAVSQTLPAGFRVSWPGDPETQIVGWRSWHETGDIESEMSPCGFLGSYEDGGQSLLEYWDFRDGTMQFSERFDLRANPAVTYTLAAITRPIAIAKHYDADGNIASIEKPLIPSAEAYKVLWKHQDGGYMNNENIYRYKLVEKTPEGIALDPAQGSLIVDVVPDSYDGSIYVFSDKESADAFYSNRAKELKDQPLVRNTILGQSAKIQLTNSLPKTSVKVTKAWDDADDQDGIRPQSVTVKLLADGADTGKSIALSEENGWAGEFADLDEYASGAKIAYTVEEVAVDRYEASVSGDAAQGFTITNSHKPSVPGKSVVPSGKSQQSQQTGRSMPRTGDNPLPALLAAAGVLGAAGVVGAAARARRKHAGR